MQNGSSSSSSSSTRASRGSFARARLAPTCFLAVVGISCGGSAAPPAAAPTVAHAPSAARAAATDAATSVEAANAVLPASFAPAAPDDAMGGKPAASGPRRLNVLLITIDSLRADMPWAGYPRDIAPALTAFEKKSVSYTRSYAISSYTAMSVAGLLAGRYPGELERSGYFFSSYPDTVLTFPDLLQKAGVRTLTAQAHFYFDRAGFRHGFDAYELLPGLSVDNKTDKNVTSPQHLELAKKMLSDKANTEHTFFAWFHFMDPHEQYVPHDGITFGNGSSRDRYDGEVAYTDQHVAKLLEFIDQQPWAKDTAVIVSSDHGEAFGEHKIYRHGFEIYEVLAHVPLMIRAPGAPPRRIDSPRSALDLAPTILDLIGVAAEPSFLGKSLVPELYGKEPEPRDVIVDLPRTSDNDRRRALIHGRYKILSYGDDEAFELYDVVADPREEKDLHRKQKTLFAEMKDRYKKAMGQIKDICPKHTERLKDKKPNRRC
jgi:choline-sulfatase